jgi:hypothetical protein
MVQWVCSGETAGPDTKTGRTRARCPLGFGCNIRKWLASLLLVSQSVVRDEWRIGFEVQLRPRSFQSQRASAHGRNMGPLFCCRFLSLVFGGSGRGRQCLL